MPNTVDNKTMRGKQPHQKIKPYVVLQYLLHNTDDKHAVSANEIVDYLKECGIYAERRSIYRDIDEINKVYWMLENDADIDEAEEVLAEDEEEKYIVYDSHLKGFYVRQQHYNADDIRLLAECVYATKFIDEKRAARLVDVVCDLVSEYQADDIKHDAFLTDRVKTENTAVYYNVSTINEAINRVQLGAKNKAIPHEPEKISFKYQKHSINDVKKQVDRRQGERYIVSPYKLLINDGNYYLLAFSDKHKEMRVYRVDRMKDVRLTGEPRDGVAAYDAIDLESYTQRVFSMFSGKKERVTLRFINPLLDTAIDRFGTKGVEYFKDDESHFKMTVEVEISDQFFGWLLGFGKKVKLLAPAAAVNSFKEYLDKIRSAY